jgi:glycosidase
MSDGSQERYFHGTRADLKPEDLIEPGYNVEPTGPIEDDPNLTDKKFPGNATKSYRSRDPLLVTGELTDWEGHAPDVLQAMKDNVERIKQLGIEAIDD